MLAEAKEEIDDATENSPPAREFNEESELISELIHTDLPLDAALVE